MLCVGYRLSLLVMWVALVESLKRSPELSDIKRRKDGQMKIVNLLAVVDAQKCVACKICEKVVRFLAIKVENRLRK